MLLADHAIAAHSAVRPLTGFPHFTFTFRRKENIILFDLEL